MIAQSFFGRAMNRQSDNRNYQIAQVSLYTSGTTVTEAIHLYTIPFLHPASRTHLYLPCRRLPGEIVTHHSDHGSDKQNQGIAYQAVGIGVLDQVSEVGSEGWWVT